MKVKNPVTTAKEACDAAYWYYRHERDCPDPEIVDPDAVVEVVLPNYGSCFRVPIIQPYSEVFVTQTGTILEPV